MYIYIYIYIYIGKARHAFKNQFAEYFALRTKMAKLELSSALTPEAVAKDKVYIYLYVCVYMYLYMYIHI
jgi:hypothetical protein